MSNSDLQLLRVSGNKRFLVKEDGTPFFWLGDTAWELFHRLNREDAFFYLENRAAKGFTVIQAVALAEFEGLTVPNAYGKFPLLKNAKEEYDPCQPDCSAEGSDAGSYWDHVDAIVDKAAELGLYVGFLPTWGDKYNTLWGKGPDIFNRDNAHSYGKWLGERYANRKNIIWILGGDRPLHTSRHFDVINALAAGLREGDEGKHLITFHPSGFSSSSLHVHEQEWLDFNMIQSGHGACNTENYKFIEEDLKKLPLKPTLDGEPRYEDHPVSFKPVNGYFDDFDVRQAAYWGVFAGGMGTTYGHHSIWSFNTESCEYYPLHWKAALDRPAAGQMRYLRNLLENRGFANCIPVQEILAENYEGANYMRAVKGSNYTCIYSPCGLKIKITLGTLPGSKVSASWYNPRNGEEKLIGEFANSGAAEFMPPSQGRNNDWVLVIDALG